MLILEAQYLLLGAFNQTLIASDKINVSKTSNILKLAVFATGLSGIVAEYVLSTLATYFLGDSVFQWTIIVSIMLFSMGVGSRLSKLFNKNLLRTFIILELVLSILVSFSALITYISSAYTIYIGAIIYIMSIAIGLLIGMEIPLVIRLNNKYDSLKVNISSILEKDYYGSLIGGMFFAFIGLPFIGLTYTPFILGGINLSVAILLLLILQSSFKTPSKTLIYSLTILTICTISIGCFKAEPIILFGEQKKYQDKVVFEKQTPYQKIVLTKWNDHHWLYINGNQQLCTLDEVMYHEPIVHPIMQLHPKASSILVLGGGDGCTVRELLKYPWVKSIDLVDIDPEMTQIGQEHPVFTKMNDQALNDEKVNIYNKDAYYFLEHSDQFYDAVIIDLPDPRTIELNRLYSLEFYKLCHRKLRANGMIITQGGSPYFATKAFLCIDKTLQQAGFQTLKLHNQIVTMGQWGWVLGSKDKTCDTNCLKKHLISKKIDSIPTKWLNQEALKHMTNFGKPFFINLKDSIEINQINHPVLYQYYLKGSWDLY